MKNKMIVVKFVKIYKKDKLLNRLIE